MSDSDEAVSSRRARQTYNPSPDLFEDSPNDVDEDSDMSSMSQSLLRRQSITHSMSDSESDSDSRNRNVSSRHNNRHSNEHKSDTGSRNGHTSKRHTSKTPEKSAKQQFLDSFLNMSDSSSDDEDEINRKIELLKQKKKLLESRHASSTQKPHKKDYSKPMQKKPSIEREKSNKSSLERENSMRKSSQERERSSKSSLEREKSMSKSSKEREKPMSKPSLEKERSLSKLNKSHKTDAEQKGSQTLKRKHSSSPVPKELRKAVTEILIETENGSAKKKLPSCKYGSECYRKNPSHFEEYSHGKVMKTENRTRSSSPPRKKIKSSPPSSSPGFSRDATGGAAAPMSHKSPKAANVGPPRSIAERFEQAQPYSFFLTKVTGIAEKYNNSLAMDIKDILSPEMGNLTASCQFNFMFDLTWLLKQYPSQFRSKPLLIVHGETGASKNSLMAGSMSMPNIKFCQARLEMMYGTHHTKMMLLLYDSGMRVVIHTSNLIANDWDKKTQGMWISPVFPRLPSPGKDKGDSATHFKRDLLGYMAAYKAYQLKEWQEHVERHDMSAARNIAIHFKRDLLAYMAAYKAYQLKEWQEHVERHDMSAARVMIIGSVPGRHLGEQNKSCWGHLKLRKVLQQHGPSVGVVKSWPVIGQFSSIGSMGPNKDSWVGGEFLQSLSATKSGSGMQGNTRMQLVFPSKDNVRLSLEGFPAGGSIPYSIHTAKKQTFLHDFFHVWKSEGRGRSGAMPHIKTYIRPKQDGSQAAWFLVTSANLSKAAWGALEKKGVQLMIRSYEIGVLLLPKFMDDAETFAVTTDMEHARNTRTLALPYDLPPQAYDKKDRPWMWDIPYMDLPDTNGNVWCPFSK